MASRRRRRRGRLRQERPALPPPPEDSSPLEPTTLRDVAIAERPSKRTFHASSSTSSSSSSSTSGPDVWADLLDSLLLQIAGLLTSFHDLLAFIGTCRSWRAVLSSLPGPPAFTLNIPPLRFQQVGCDSHPHCSFVKRALLSNIKWQLVDPVKQTSSLCCSAPRNIRDRVQYLGCSYGYLIFSSFEQCLLVDVYSGAVVRPPKRKSTGNLHIYYGILVAPISASNSHLLISSGSSMFQWKVGSSSWLEHPLDGGSICHITSFKGQVFGMDSFQRLHRIHLAPQLSMHEVAVVWGEGMVVGLTCKPLLVACGDMLLLVVFSESVDNLSGLINMSSTKKICTKLNYVGEGTLQFRKKKMEYKS
ncbi:hypothetical protein U9M48_030082 [Paspalum notatum var. saurae]|uniref:KIB1-4 beta-propeller domain-containing protein n=1 Tax=Paspalum notatum var. saurae TaxID=547442 RepID=A0AAQ3X1S4_PASNO